MPSTLELSVQDAIATLTITKTTMPPVFFRELREAFREINGNSELRAVIIQSKVKCFTYGLDLPAAFQEFGPMFSGGTAAQRTELNRLILDLQDCLSIIERCPVPVIAAIHGYCIGGGIDLITCCDIRLATTDATFSVRETKTAIVADLGTLQRLPKIVGQGHAKELAFTGGDIDAEHAERIGLVNHIHSDQEAVHDAALAMAKEIAANPPLTVRGVKSVMDFSRDHGTEAGLSFVAAWNSAFLASEDLGEAMSAFMAKRPPQFKGK